jgi:hypothetical protein
LGCIGTLSAPEAAPLVEEGPGLAEMAATTVAPGRANVDLRPLPDFDHDLRRLPQVGRRRRPSSHVVAFLVSHPVVSILALQAVLSLRLVWSNTAFSDEALYLWAGHLEIAHWLHGATMPPFATYFSGAPVIYPPIGALADSVGGLTAARLLSMGFMLGTTALLYDVTRLLVGRRAAAFGSALFVVLGPVQLLGAFATYDAMALFLVALAAWLVTRAQGRGGELLLAAGGLTLALADATKYAAALWSPVIIGLAGLVVVGGGWRRPAFRAARVALYAGVPAVAALYGLGGSAYVRGVMFTTLDRKVSGGYASVSSIMVDSFEWVGVVFVLAALGTAICFFTTKGRQKWLFVVLTAAVALAPLHQAQIHTATSLHKHVAFGAWFGCVVAGYVLAKGSEVNLRRGWRVGAAAAGIGLFLGVPQADNMFILGWPNTSRMNAELAQLMPVYGCPCLVAQQNPVRYYLPHSGAYKIFGPYDFYYWNTSLRREQNGLPAYERAIKAHYFSVVEMDPAENLAIYGPITRLLRSTKGYYLQDSIHIDQWGDKTLQIWLYQGLPNG